MWLRMRKKISTSPRRPQPSSADTLDSENHSRPSDSHFSRGIIDRRLHLFSSISLSFKSHRQSHNYISDFQGWRCELTDLYLRRSEAQTAELRSTFHFNADSLGCLRSGRSFTLPSHPPLGSRHAGRGVEVGGDLESPYFYPQPVTFLGVAPCRPPPDVQRARPPRSRRAAIRREVQGSSCFFTAWQPCTYMWLGGKWADASLPSLLPPRHSRPCLSFGITRITTTRGCGNERLVDAVSVEGGRYDALHVWVNRNVNEWK